MDQEELKNIIALYFTKLPNTAQSFFEQMGWLKNIDLIASKHNLSESQKEDLATETTLVLLAVINTEEYESKIQELDLPENEKVEIVNEVKALILNYVIEDINNAYINNKKELEDVANELEQDEKEAVGEDEGGQIVDNNTQTIQSFPIQTQTPVFTATKPTSQMQVSAVAPSNTSTQIEPELTDPRFARLPEYIRKVIAGSNYQGILYDIGKEFNLNISEMGVLEKATTSLIVGAMHPDKFEEYLRTNLKFDFERTIALSTAINEKIFKKIREGIMSAERAPVSTPAPIPAPAREPVQPVVPPQASYQPTYQPAPAPVQPMAAPAAPVNPPTYNPIPPAPIPMSAYEVPRSNPAPQPVANNPILAQKLSGFVQNDVVETEHYQASAEERAKPNATPGMTSFTPRVGNIPVTPPAAPRTYQPGADPYRVKPE